MAIQYVKKFSFTVKFELARPQYRAVDGNDDVSRLLARLDACPSSTRAIAQHETTDEGDVVVSAIIVEAFASELDVVSTLIQLDFEVARATVDEVAMCRLE